MSEAPRSLLEDPDASPLLRSMLEDARAQEGLDAAAVDRIAQRAEALGPAPRMPTSSLMPKLGLVTVAVAMLGAGAWLALRSTPMPAPVPEAMPSAPTVDEDVRAEEVQPQPVQAVIEHDEPEPPEAREHAAQPSEGALLLSARVALRGGNAAGALALTSQHERLFPRGAMREERDVIAIEALMLTGDRTRASRRAEAFLHRYPSSPYRARVEGFVEGARE